MAASHPESAWREALVLAAFLVAGLPAAASSQVPAEPVLHGRAFVGDSALSHGMVLLHRVSSETQGEIDSTRVARDGSFTFRLPTVPDPGRSEVYFASVRHSGILYFGTPINTAIQLDSLYEIHAYDTLVAPEGGVALTVEARNVFLEQQGDHWLVTDLFQVRNDEPRTLVAPEGGYVWRYPLPEGLTNPEVAPSELASGAAAVENGALVVRTPLPPGTRLFVIRYDKADPFLDIPLPGVTETMEFLVKEPAPPMDVPVLEATNRVALEPGTTYRRFSATKLQDTAVRVTRAKPAREPPVRWFAVILGLTLGAVGVWAVQPGRLAPARAQPAGPDARRALILQVARLDEAFAAKPGPTAEERGAYEARRADLLRRIQHLP